MNEQLINFYNKAKPYVIGFFKKAWAYIKFAWIPLTILAGVLAFDLITKGVAARQLTLSCTNCGSRGQSVDFIPNFLQFRYTHNYGIAFGLFANPYSGGARALLAIITSVMALGFIIAMYRFRRENMWSKMAFAFIIAGALGNIFDRMFLGYVRDFLQFSGWIGGWFSFIFNIADVALIVGVIMLGVWMIFMYRPQKNFVGPVMPKDWNEEKESKMKDDNTNIGTVIDRPNKEKLSNAEDDKNVGDAALGVPNVNTHIDKTAEGEDETNS